MIDDRLHQGCSYGELIKRAVDRWPDRTAFIDDDETITYREFGQRVARVAEALAGLGLVRGDGLAQLSSNRIDAFVVNAAALVAGIRFTPLHPLGAADDQAYILDDGEIAALVVDAPGFAERGGDLAARTPGLKHLLTLGPADAGDDLLALAATSTASRPAPVAEATDIAWLAYTGGTTGRPKGVMLSHRSLVTNAILSLAEWDWPRDIRLLAATPITHAAGIIILPVLLRGGTVVMHKGFDPDAFLETVEKERISATFLVPTMIYVLLDHAETRKRDLSSLELIIYGAAPMSPARLIESLDVFGPVFFQLYAQTEAPNTVTALRIADHDPANPERLASCGSPLAGLQVELMGPDDTPVPDGEVGEICVRGPLVMDGYWKRPEETAETLKNGWLHTGDMARRDEDGFLYIVDRAKDMIISGGFNVYPREVEDVITTHPGVAMAAVIGIPDEKWGEAVKAVVVRKSDADVTAADLIDLVRDMKGPVQTPKTVDFVDDLPLTALGKPDKKAVRALYWDDAGRQVH
jgi:fatty-acyl-CoA synthase